MTEVQKSERLNAIKELLKAFSEEHLNDELAGYSLNLCERIGRKRDLSVVRGKRETWAAAIVYVIARLNFLFDRQHEYSITPDTICEFFGTKRTTTTNKAREIEQACDIAMGEEGLCSQDIADALTLVELPGGFVATRNMLQGDSVEIEFVDGEEAKELEKALAEHRRVREQAAEEKKARRAAEKEKAAEEKKRKERKRQSFLFDD